MPRNKKPGPFGSGLSVVSAQFCQVPSDTNGSPTGLDAQALRLILPSPAPCPAQAAAYHQAAIQCRAAAACLPEAAASGFLVQADNYDRRAGLWGGLA